MAKEDVGKEECPLWKVDNQNLLQKFVPSNDGTGLVYKSCSTVRDLSIENNQILQQKDLLPKHQIGLDSDNNPVGEWNRREETRYLRINSHQSESESNKEINESSKLHLSQHSLETSSNVHFPCCNSSDLYFRIKSIIFIKPQCLLRPQNNRLKALLLFILSYLIYLSVLGLGAGAAGILPLRPRALCGAQSECQHRNPRDAPHRPVSGRKSFLV